jgi:Hypothetical protein (DUF2513)
MKLNIDFVRDLLLQIEAGQTMFQTASAEVAANLGYEPEKPLSQEDADKLRWHLDWAVERGLIEIEFRSLADAYSVKSLTEPGREFLQRGQKSKAAASPVPVRQGGEIFTAKPAFMGMSIDLKELGRRVSSWRKCRR